MIPVIDLFAGPGGLNEGFSRVRRPDGEPAFDVVSSFEMEANAIQTLRLRSAIRKLSEGGELPAEYVEFLNNRRTKDSFFSTPRVEWALEQAAVEARQVELGPGARDDVVSTLTERLAGRGDSVLIGGPPCQAYSLVGRSRRAHDSTFLDDVKHFLFEEYLHILKAVRPAIFVMENVKGLLSSTHGSIRMFERIREDLSLGGEYDIHSLVTDGEVRPSDFVVKAEQYGVPQRRHRVILLGVRRGGRPPALLTASDMSVTLRDAIEDMPAIRSLVSPRSQDSKGVWVRSRDEGRLAARVSTTLGAPPEVGGPWVPKDPTAPATELMAWLRRPELEGVTLHEARAHMHPDLRRYAYLGALAEDGRAPSVLELPAHMRPNHKNIRNEQVPFIDRFKVQPWDRPSSTVTAHLSKDGHHFIHPDARQMRTLTVREAARLQTFPDDYYFMGSRTAQFQQVGNAVPPLLAHQIAAVVAEALV